MPNQLIELQGHTEGPWQVDGNEVWMEIQGRGYTLCEVCDWEPFARPVPHANARLIAAAPDLLAIARELHEIVAGGAMLVEHAEAIWTSRGIAPPSVSSEGEGGGE